MRDSLNEELLDKLAAIMDAPDELLDKGTKVYSNGSGRMDSKYQVTEWVKYDDVSRKSGTKINVMYSPHCTNMPITFQRFRVIKFKNAKSIFQRSNTFLDLNDDSAGIHDISSRLHCYTLRADRIFHENYMKKQADDYKKSLRETEEKLAQIL